MNDREPAVELDAVVLAQGPRTLLADASFRVGQGEIIGLLGPNGAGKSTLLRALLGLVRPRAGRISVLGRPVRPGATRVGYLPQTEPNGQFLSAWDVVAAGAAGNRLGLPWRGGTARAEIDAALAELGATHLAGRRYVNLSGGERQRVRLAQAVLGRPALLLLDEPLVSLDPAAQAETVALLRAIRARLGCAIVVSSHEINPLLPAIDRVLYLARGALALGPVDQVITTKVLSRLYGAPVEVVRVGGRIFVLPGEATLPLDRAG